MDSAPGGQYFEPSRPRWDDALIGVSEKSFVRYLKRFHPQVHQMVKERIGLIAANSFKLGYFLESGLSTGESRVVVEVVITESDSPLVKPDDNVNLFTEKGWGIIRNLPSYLQELNFKWPAQVYYSGRVALPWELPGRVA